MVKLIKLDPAIRKMAVEVMKQVRSQSYTPEQLCDIQNIIDAKYFYYWSMDMKKEEFVCDLFTEDFTYRCYQESKTSPREQALRAKYVNRNMSTMHMSHHPLVWLMSETQARGIFLYEDHNTFDDGQTISGFSVYCDDFQKCDDGVWRISALRVGYRKMDGQFKDVDVPKDWEPKRWEEWKVER